MTDQKPPSPLPAVSADQIEQLFHQIPFGVALFDASARLVCCNPKFAGLMERHSKIEAALVRPGIHLLDVFPGNEALGPDAIARVLSGDTVFTDALRTESEGRVSYWDRILSPVLQDGKTTGIIDIVMDVTGRAEAMMKVQESEATLRSLVENASRFAIYRIEIDPALPYGGRVVFASPSICDIVGIEDSSQFKTWFQGLHPDDEARVLAANEHSLKTGETYNQVTRVFHRQRQEWVWVHTISNPYQDASGKVTHFDGMVIDVTDQVTLREAERRRAAAEGLRDILRMINSNQPLKEILQQIAKQAKELLKASSTMIRQVVIAENKVITVASCDLPADFDLIQEQPFYQATTDQALLRGDPVIIEDVAAEYLPRLAGPVKDDPLRRAGLEITLNHYHSLLKMPLFLKGQIFGAITFHYAEPRAFSEEDMSLAATLADQAALAIENARLIEKVKETAVLEERSRLARELHDAVTQTLFSTTLMAEVLPVIWEKNPAEGRRKLEELRELTRGALAEMRTLLVELRPAALEDAELKDLLRHLSNAFIARARIPVLLEMESSRDIPLDVKIAFYRVAQEALNNIARHAEASRVSVTLRQEPAQVSLQIEDDGIGFEVGEQLAGHYGLRIMRERAAQTGAALTIQSRPGHGACICIRWPVETQQEKFND